MHIEVKAGEILTVETGLAVLGVWEGEDLPAVAQGLMEAEDFTGAFKKFALLYPRNEKKRSVAARRLLLAGLGKREHFSVDRLRQIGALIGRRARDLGQKTFATELLGQDVLDAFTAARALAEGVQLGLYRFEVYKTRKESDQPGVEVESVAILVRSDSEEAARRAVELAEAEMAGVKLARDLGNEPPLVATPTMLAEVAQEIAQRHGMTVAVFNREQMEELGMGGILNVSRGSAEPPKFIILEHGSKQPGVPTVVLVGKGITFDTGGISIKPAADMDKMKMDMMGGGAVLGAMEVVGRLKLPMHVVGIVPASENTPSGTAYKPGDIIRAMNGVTIEVLNTDAEGRLVLADGLAYAQRYEPDAIIDLATLTGACVVALGNHAAGMMGNSSELAERVKRAAQATGERVWELPLWDEYKNQIKSDIADIKNVGGRNAGAITGGAFLSHFVGTYPWVHLDIAGVAWTEDQPKPYTPKGATGFGVRLLTELLRTWDQERS